MSGYEQKLSYREIINMSKGNSAKAKQQRMINKYGNNSSNINHKLKNINEENKGVNTVITGENSDNKEKLSHIEPQSEMIIESFSENDLPDREVNSIKKFEKIYAKYLP